MCTFFSDSQWIKENMKIGKIHRAMLKNKQKQSSVLYCIICVCFMIKHVHCECMLTQACNPPVLSLYDVTELYADSSLTVTSVCSANNYLGYLDVGTTTRVCEYVDHQESFMSDRYTEAIDNYTFINPHLDTYWQSGNVISSSETVATEVQIDIDMVGTFLVRRIRIIFKVPHAPLTGDVDMRPLAMTIQRKVSDGFGGFMWADWRTYSSDCSTTTGGKIVTRTSSTSVTPTEIFCEQAYYGGDTASHTGWGKGLQQVRFYFSNLSFKKFCIILKIASLLSGVNES